MLLKWYSTEWSDVKVTDFHLQYGLDVFHLISHLQKISLQWVMQESHFNIQSHGAWVTKPLEVFKNNNFVTKKPRTRHPPRRYFFAKLEALGIPAQFRALVPISLSMRVLHGKMLTPQLWALFCWPVQSKSKRRWKHNFSVLLWNCFNDNASYHNWVREQNDLLAFGLYKSVSKEQHQQGQIQDFC